MLLEDEIKRIKGSISQNELTLKGLASGTKEYGALQDAIYILKEGLNEANAKLARLYP